MAQTPERIRSLRLAQHLTHEGLAFAAGLSVATIQRAEAGTHETSTKNLRAIAMGLGVSLAEVIAEPQDAA